MNPKIVSRALCLLAICATAENRTAQADGLPDPDAPIATAVTPVDPYSNIINKADAQVKLGQWAATLISAQEAIHTDATQFKGYYYAAYALYRMDSIDEAQSYLQEALARAPQENRDEVLRLRDAITKKHFALEQIKVGDAALAQGLIAKAATAYTTAWEDLPSREDLGIKAAGLWSDRLNNVAEAARILNAIAAHPIDPDLGKQASTTLQALQPALQKVFEEKLQDGQQLLAQGKADDAQRDFEIAAQTLPTRQDPHVHLARIYSAQNNPNDALSELSQVFKLGPATVDDIFNHPEFATLLPNPRFQSFLNDALGVETAKKARAKITAAAASDPAAIFTNGDFSAGTTTPKAWELLDNNLTAQVKIVRDALDFKMGPASLRLDVTGAPVGATVYQEFNALPTEPFIITGYTKAANKWDSIRVYLQFYDGAWKLVNWTTLKIEPTPNWQQFSKSITLPEGTQHAVFFLKVQGQGKIWMDEVKAFQETPATDLLPVSTVPEAVVKQVADLTDTATVNNERQQWLATTGLSDKAIQDVLVYMTEQEQQKKALDDASTVLRATLLSKDASPKQLNAAMTQYQTAQQDYAKRRRKAESDLDAKVGFSRNPKIKASLVVMGALGDSSAPTDLKAITDSATSDATLPGNLSTTATDALKATAANAVDTSVVTDAVDKAKATAQTATDAAKGVANDAKEKAEQPIKEKIGKLRNAIPR